MCELNWIPVSERYPYFDIKETSKDVFVQTKRGENFVAYCKRSESYFTDDYIYEWYTYGTGGRRMKVMSKVVAWAEFNKYEGK